jgi:HopJ type III effector protein
MKLAEFLKKMNESPEKLMLEDTLSAIDAMYEFKPVAFSNGHMQNEAGQNPRSCRLYAFAKLQNFSNKQTLLCFGEHYREVLSDPGGTSHETIRIFMKQGWEGLWYSEQPLKLKVAEGHKT